MIYDRKYVDIINARKLYYNKVQKSIELTEEEQAVIDRAVFNLTSLNRITAKINDIWLSVVGFGGEKAESEDVREWGEQEFFTLSNFSNIRENIGQIIEQMKALPYFDYETYKKMYNSLNDEYLYTNINNIEKLLYDIGEMLDKNAIKVSKNLYVVGAYSATMSEGVLTIE